MRERSIQTVGLALRLLRDEGPTSVWNRILDRRDESRRRRELSPLDVGNDLLDFDVAPPPVVNISPVPPSPNRGGAQIQMLDRLDVERQARTVALLYPDPGGWLLEIWSSRVSGILNLGSGTPIADVAVRAARLVGARAFHIENAHGLPIELPRQLNERGFQSVISLHDFALFCRRPHLIDASSGDFCDYSVNMTRCAACLAAGDSLDHPSQTEYRTAGAEAIGCANSLVFPSDFLQRRYRLLYPDRHPSQHETIISPATRRWRQPSSRDLDRPNVAFIGGVVTHKGGALIGSIWQRLLEALPETKGVVYGNGESTLLQRLKASNRLHVRGYYRRNELTRRLDSDRIGVSILPSIWPETYGLVVDESLAAGVPVVAFDLGAVADRLGSLGVGRLVPKHLGPVGLAEAAVQVMSSQSPVPESIIKSLPEIEESARLSMDVYQNLLANAP